MNTRQSWIIGTAIVLGCLILGLFFGQPATGQKKEKPVTPGRYQVGGGVQPVVIDTVTGQTWQYSPRGIARWFDLGSPVQKKK
jgi:hypothetical protein